MRARTASAPARDVALAHRQGRRDAAGELSELRRKRRREVLEHCPDPWAAGAEIARVLRPGGWAFVSTPFLRPLHEAPHDYHRFTPWGLTELAQRCGLTVERIAPRGDYVAVFLMTLLLPI